MKKNKQVTVIGLGYIGLPTSILMANKGLKVFGYDIDFKKVERINNLEFFLNEPNYDKLYKEAINSNNLICKNELTPSDVYVIVVPTPFKENKKPDLSFIESAVNNLAPLLKVNDLIILESTSPIGTTQKIKNQIKNIRPDIYDDVFYAYCPERVIPGNIFHELQFNDRIVGGIDSKSSVLASNFYKNFVSGEVIITNSQTAELCKLTENSYRDLQIAFANQLSIFCDKNDINVNEVISLANRHPRIEILNPSCGVGGHCLPVDPYFLIDHDKDNTTLISEARKINLNKEKFVLKKIISSIERANYSKNTKIGVFGISYKPDVDDFRESPALSITNNLISYFKDRYEIVIYDSFVSKDLIKKNYNINVFDYNGEELSHAIKLVNHSNFKNINCEELINFS